MSLFKKNVPLQEEEEVAPVMQEYSGQHPVLNFKVSAIVKSDHLDQYMEVHPFESSEPRYDPTDQVNKENNYAEMLVKLGFELREKTEEDKLPWQRFSDLKTSGGDSFLLKVKMIFDPRSYRTGKIKEKPDNVTETTNIIYLPLSLTNKKKIEVEKAAIKLTTFRTENSSKLLLGNASKDDQFKQLSNLVEIPFYRGWIVKFEIL